MKLDVRAIPISERHATILSHFERLPVGQTMEIVSDHEPRPLRAELTSRSETRLRWGQNDLGDGRWEIRIVKLDTTGLTPIQQAIYSCDALAGGTPATLRDLAYYSRLTTIKRHHCVVARAIRWPYVGIVAGGIVQAQFESVSGHAQVLYDLLSGDFFGETALFDDGFTAFRFDALTPDTAVVLIPKERVKAAMLAERNIRAGIERTAAQHSRSMAERLVEMRSRSSTARIAALLLPYATPEPYLSEALAPLPAMTQAELALEAGSAKEVVSRALRELEDIQAIRRDRGRLVKLHRERLLYAINHL